MTVAVIGEALVDLIACEDGRFRPCLGGSPYNVAIGLARQEVATSYLCPFSIDAFGDRLRQNIEKERVQLPLDRRSDLPTSLALVVLDDSGAPAYRLYRDAVADKDTSESELIRCLPDDLTILHTGSLAITPSQLDKTRAVFRHVRDQGAKISIDINLRSGASRHEQAYVDGVRSLIPWADIVKASDEDLEVLGLKNGSRRNAETIFSEMDDGMLLFTEGDGGALLYTGHGIIEQQAFRVEDVADTVGAGDTFHSTFLASLVRSDLIHQQKADMPLQLLAQALEAACAAAAINVSRVGCSPPTWQETQDFLDERRNTL